jgi:hypothetical protein
MPQDPHEESTFSSTWAISVPTMRPPPFTGPEDSSFIEWSRKRPKFPSGGRLVLRMRMCAALSGYCDHSIRRRLARLRGRPNEAFYEGLLLPWPTLS